MASASEARAYSGPAAALTICPIRHGRRAAAAPGSLTVRADRGVGKPARRKPYDVHMGACLLPTLRQQGQDIGGRLHGV
ncbi:hypothetical protein ACQP2K_25390 [Microbispora siamensis]